MTETELSDIERRWSRATPGPWRSEALTSFEVLILSAQTTVVHAKLLLPSDEDFIAKAPSDVASLLAEVKRLRAERDAWKMAAPVLPLTAGFCPECGVVGFDDSGLCDQCGALATGMAVTEMRFRIREAESDEPFVPAY
jgi:hypothetical protein